MALSRERKIYIALGAIAVAALAIDRLVLDSPASGPDDASAMVSEDTPAPADLSPEPQKPPASFHAKWSQLQPDPLTCRLDEMATHTDITNIPDAFNSPSWSFALPSLSSQGHVSPLPLSPDATAQFVRNHRLKAVISSPTSGYALLDNHTILAVGDTIDGFSVQAVADRSALFSPSQPQPDTPPVRLTFDHGM